MILDKFISKNKITIVIPTYNERNNIERLVRRIAHVCKKSSYNYEIIVIDDNSPDGTADVVEKLKERNVILIKRSKKLGLGSAYVEGFKKAIKKKADLIFQMDGDLSHHPKYILKFIEKVNEGYDVVVGSRLMKGGKVVGWDFSRRLISWGGNVIGRYIAGVDVSDLTSGYRAYKREVLEAIDLDSIKSSSYDFQLEMLAKAINKGFEVGTVPIIFYGRKYGKSKLTKLDQLKFLITAVKIRFRILQ